MREQYCSWSSATLQFNWVFQYQVNDKEYIEFDDKPLKGSLEDISLTEPVVLSFIRKEIKSGVKTIRPEFEY